MTYETKGVLPPDPNVRIIFHGLLSFFFDSVKECRVGVHNTTHGSRTHPHPHHFEVAAWAAVGAVCVPVPLPPGAHRPGWLAGVRIEAHGTREVDGVYVYQKGRGRQDENDWRWVVDFESGVLYPEGVKNRPSTLRPHVAVTDGLFYTLRKTETNFILRPDNGGVDIFVGNVAEIVAANVYLAPGGRIDLIFAPLNGEPQTVPLIAVPGVKYEINVTNSCWQGNKPCDFNPGGGKPEDRNDFYLYYETFHLPAKRPRYDLICTDCSGRKRPARKDAERILQELDICYDRKRGPGIVSNDKAPCGPAGHGQSTDPSQA